MDEVYDLHRDEYSSYITYDKKKSKVLSWGEKCDKEDEDKVQIEISGEKLHQLFKTCKDKWSEDDRFLFTAASDFIGLSVEKLMKVENKNVRQIKDTGTLHYVFVVPSEWEEEIREDLIRPIFVRANLISEGDHKDRLLFCTDIESTYYSVIRKPYNNNLKLSRNTIIGVINAVEESKVSIKLNSSLIGNPLFDFSKSLLFPKLVASNSLYLTTNDVKNGIREFIKINFSFDAQEETIKNIMEEINPDSSYKIQRKNNVSDLNKFFIIGKGISVLDKKHETLIKSIRPIDICAEISKHLSNNLELLLPNKTVKEYSLLRLTTKISDYKVDKGLLDWSEYLFEYNRISFGSNYIIPIRLRNTEFDYSGVLGGAIQYLFEAIQNSDIYSKPRILPTEHSTTSSSIFLNTKPDAIFNIDISLESTALSFSLLDENGLVKDIRSHKYFVPGIPLRSLGSFFRFSEVTTLNVKSSFIASVKEHLTDKTNISSCELNKEVENILNFESHNKDLLVSTQQQVYIKAFILYQKNCQQLQQIMLFGTEDDLRDKDDSSKKLRITTHGEGLFPVIKQYFDLQFPLNSFFVVAQLYKSYVLLTLNQVVTESGLDNEYQEAIIIKEEMIPIPNIYDTLCFNMWKNITGDSSLIELCDTHTGYNDYELLEIFSLENQAEFTKNLEEYISKNILNETLNEQKADTATISLSTLCKCKVCLTANDITEISFRPVLQDIISLIFTSLIDKQLFEKYGYIHYVFNLIRFNYNPQFQHILTKILKDETDEFLYEERIDIAHYIFSKLSNQLLQPVLDQKPFLYKAFQVGALYHVYSENYGFGIKIRPRPDFCKFKNKISNSKIISVNEETGDKISITQIKRVFYLSSENTGTYLETRLFRLKKAYTLSFDKTVHAEDKLENIGGPSCSGIDHKQGHYIPFIVSILYKGHSFSISLALKNVGGEIKKRDCAILADPMTLAYF
ncbi:hypothetical protein MFLAVUS_005031 [Mucor flavus]|uniref:Uncharacterized protein n=1 Tax=Mucor flavus TaxID=439312 RepID=A0ABP9YXK9_9FUNG